MLKPDHDRSTKPQAPPESRPSLSGTSLSDPGRCRRLHFNNTSFDDLTHYLFRYPAKFHPPVVRELLQAYTERGELVLDPFCGSGTLLVEAATLGRHAIGVDIDPVATFVSQIKTHRYNCGHLLATTTKFLSSLDSLERMPYEYEARQFEDLTEGELEKAVRKEFLWVPNIPNLFHWFRKYVILDLARIWFRIAEASIPETHRNFLKLSFASILRNASNADPVPVSGLEYTSHMRQRDARGRLINPFQLYRAAVRTGVGAAENYFSSTTPTIRTRARNLDVLSLSKGLHSYKPDVVITSPPYHSAVNYYRRHQLEMFWLGFTRTHGDRLALKHNYIGRPKVPVSDPLLQAKDQLPPLSQSWLDRIASESPGRARAFNHYSIAMKRASMEIASLLETGAPAIFIIGHSRWQDQELPTTDLLAELLQPQFSVEQVLWYPLENRYMSYSRHNGANINKEYVLITRRK